MSSGFGVDCGVGEDRELSGYRVGDYWPAGAANPRGITAQLHSSYQRRAAAEKHDGQMERTGCTLRLLTWKEISQTTTTSASAFVPVNPFVQLQ